MDAKCKCDSGSYCHAHKRYGVTTNNRSIKFKAGGAKQPCGGGNRVFYKGKDKTQ